MTKSTIRSKVRALLNESVKRLPYVLLVLLVLTSVQFYRLSSQTALGVQAAKNNSEQISRNTGAIKDNTDAISKSVKDLKADNRQQTKILCRLILQGNLLLTDEESAQVESICKEAVQRANLEAAQTSATPAQNASQRSKSSQSAAFSSSSKSSTSNASSQSNNSQGPLMQNILQPAQDFIHSLLSLQSPYIYKR